MNQSEWFLKKFREWETLKGRKQTEAAFAKYLGVKPPTLNRWMTSSSTPEGENMRMLARKLGPEIYAIVGQPQPDDLFLDAQLEPLAEIILSFPPEKRQRVRELIVKYAVELSKIVDP